jgi:hypothetical protein
VFNVDAPRFTEPHDVAIVEIEFLLDQRAVEVSDASLFPHLFYVKPNTALKGGVRKGELFIDGSATIGDVRALAARALDRPAANFTFATVCVGGPRGRRRRPRGATIPPRLLLAAHHGAPVARGKPRDQQQQRRRRTRAGATAVTPTAAVECACAGHAWSPP